MFEVIFAFDLANKFFAESKAKRAEQGEEPIDGREIVRLFKDWCEKYGHKPKHGYRFVLSVMEIGGIARDKRGRYAVKFGNTDFSVYGDDNGDICREFFSVYGSIDYSVYEIYANFRGLHPVSQECFERIKKERKP
jgi:hypothetical protein